MIYQFISAFIGTVAFSLIFHVPKRYYPACGVIGGTGWLVFLFFAQGFSEFLAAFLATCVVTFLSRAGAIYKKCPVTIFLISGIFPLVPGAGIYWTAYYLVTNQNELCVNSGITTVKTAFAIVLGIVFVFEIPQSFFQKIFSLIHRKEKIT